MVMSVYDTRAATYTASLGRLAEPGQGEFSRPPSVIGKTQATLTAKPCGPVLDLTARPPRANPPGIGMSIRSGMTVARVLSEQRPPHDPTDDRQGLAEQTQHAEGERGASKQEQQEKGHDVDLHGRTTSGEPRSAP
jgi:hypothetical protein